MPVTPHGIWWRPPDGAELVFQGRELNRYAIYAVRPDGSGLRRITPGSSDDRYMWPFSLSPDGRQLAYTRGGPLVHVRFLDIDTGEDHRFGTALPSPAPNYGGAREDGFAVFSPDGGRVVFGRYWDEREDRINHQLWVASADGNGKDAVALGPVTRTVSGNNPFGVSFSPDGKRILLNRTDIRQVFIGDATGGPVVNLPWDTGEIPDWQRVAPRR